MVIELECWRPIPGYVGLYSVSDIGRVRRDGEAPGARVGRIRKARINEKGYRRLNLYRGGHDTIAVRYVHALVAEAFLGPRPDGLQVRHLDGDSLNNCVENLAYGTPSENVYDRVRHGRDRSASKTHCLRGHELREPNLVPSTSKKGSRGCLACNRAHAHVRTHPALELAAVADRYYAAIVGKGQS